MPSILDLNFAGVVEPETAPEGTEIFLTIRSAKIEENKKHTGSNIVVTFYDQTNPRFRPFTAWFPIPDPSLQDSDPVKYNDGMLRIQRFLACFDLPSAGVNIEDEYPGKTGWAILREEEDDTFGKQNSIKKFITR